MSIIDRLNAILGSEDHGAVNTENTPDINKAVSDVGEAVTEDPPIKEAVTSNIVKPTGIPSEAESATPPAKEVVAGTEEVTQTTIINETVQDPALDTVVVQTPEGDVTVVETPEEVIVPPFVDVPADVVVETPVTDIVVPVVEEVVGTEEIVETVEVPLEVTPPEEVVAPDVVADTVVETVAVPVDTPIATNVIPEIVEGSEEIVQVAEVAPSVDDPVPAPIDNAVEVTPDSPSEIVTVSSGNEDAVVDTTIMNPVVDVPVDDTVMVDDPAIINPPIDGNVIEVETPPLDVSVEGVADTTEEVVMVHPVDHATALAAVTASKEAAVAAAQMEAQESVFEAQMYEADSNLQTAATLVESQSSIIDQTQSDIEKLEERIEDMEINLSGLESMLNGTNPWNPELAKVYYDNCSRISSRTFGTESITSIKGMESFSDKDTAKLEILAGTEAMEKRAKKMVEGSKQFFIKMFNAAIDFVEGINGSVKSLVAKSDVLVEALNKAPDDRIKETINLGKWNAYVNVEKGDGVDHLAKVRKSLDMIGDALKTQNINTIVSDIDKSLKNLVGSTNKNGKFDVGSANLGGITFKVKTLSSAGENGGYEGLSQVSVQYSKNAEVKTSGEHKTGFGKQKLLDLAKVTKSEAEKIKNSKITAASLKSARDKAIAAFESASSENSAKITKAASSVGINIARTLFNYQIKLIGAQQELVYAHLKK